jgi:hypothetical protein
VASFVGLDAAGLPGEAVLKSRGKRKQACRKTPTAKPAITANNCCQAANQVLLEASKGKIAKNGKRLRKMAKRSGNT